MDQDCVTVVMIAVQIVIIAVVIVTHMVVVLLNAVAIVVIFNIKELSNKMYMLQ